MEIGISLRVFEELKDGAESEQKAIPVAHQNLPEVVLDSQLIQEGAGLVLLINQRGGVDEDGIDGALELAESALTEISKVFLNQFVEQLLGLVHFVPLLADVEEVVASDLLSLAEKQKEDLDLHVFLENLLEFVFELKRERGELFEEFPGDVGFVEGVEVLLHVQHEFEGYVAGQNEEVFQKQKDSRMRPVFELFLVEMNQEVEEALEEEGEAFKHSQVSGAEGIHRLPHLSFRYQIPHVFLQIIVVLLEVLDDLHGHILEVQFFLLINKVHVLG